MTVSELVSRLGLGLPTASLMASQLQQCRLVELAAELTRGVDGQ